MMLRGSIEGQLNRLEHRLATEPVTDDKRQAMMQSVIYRVMTIDIRTGLFVDAEDPAAAIRSAFNQQLHHFKNYPVTPKDGVGAVQWFDLYDNGQFEFMYRDLVRIHFDANTAKRPTSLASRAPYGERPQFKVGSLRDPVPVFHYDERGIVEQFYFERPACSRCRDDMEPMLVKPVLVLCEEDGDKFDRSDSQWQAWGNELMKTPWAEQFAA